jgi:hypothetical protein
MKDQKIDIDRASSKYEQQYHLTNQNAKCTWQQVRVPIKDGVAKQAGVLHIYN